MFNLLLLSAIALNLQVQAWVWTKSGEEWQSDWARESPENWSNVNWEDLEPSSPLLNGIAWIYDGAMGCNAFLLKTWMGTAPPAGVPAYVMTAGHCVVEPFLLNPLVKLKTLEGTWADTSPINVTVTFLDAAGVKTTIQADQLTMGDRQVGDFAIVRLKATVMELRNRGMKFYNLAPYQDLTNRVVNSYGRNVFQENQNPENWTPGDKWSRSCSAFPYHRTGKAIMRTKYDNLKIHWAHDTSSVPGFSGSPYFLENWDIVVGIDSHEPSRKLTTPSGETKTVNLMARVDYLVNCFRVGRFRVATCEAAWYKVQGLRVPAAQT